MITSVSLKPHPHNELSDLWVFAYLYKVRCVSRGDIIFLILNIVYYIVFLYIADKFSGELKASDEGNIFWYPLNQLVKSDKLIDGFCEMLSVFIDDDISEIYYERIDNELKTYFC